ncbi:hypothetical protein [Mycobacterium paragordonae]|uniref:hypothetical protein n=1 Tax=Mycobacterium paragordonae TaxID=1389713 RepID=UPI0012E27DD0|nr:hypothetical protein [Mycobacterium paragordonae]
MTRAVRNTPLDEWSVLLRETLQNSVDARLSDHRRITFLVTLDQATTAQRGCLQQQVFADIPTHLRPLKEVLDRADLPVLVIADWNTRGLCGPTRADLATQERADFRDFFLNVGREEAKTYAGGTFGLGRGVLFDISEAGTIVVFTRTTSGGRSVSRLMAMSIGPAYDYQRHKYTGRHWWGDEHDQCPEPVTGATAESVASQLNIDVIPEDCTGTAIMVLAPRIPSSFTADDQLLGLDETLDVMINAALLHGWPLMVGRRGKPSVDFLFGQRNRDEYWQPPAPADANSPVRKFVEAYQIADKALPPDSPTSWQYREIKFRNRRAAARPLGTLVFRHFPPLDGSVEGVDAIPRAAVALMRSPRLVVSYLNVPGHPAGSSTVGVFIADDAFDETFAHSEPVAHDDWIPAKVASTRYGPNPVKQALDKIKQEIKTSWTPSLPPGATDVDGLAPRVGDLLGGLLAETPGFGPSTTSPPAPRLGGHPRSTRATVKPPILRVAPDGAAMAIFPVQVARVRNGTSVRLHAEARVVLDRGLEPDDDRPQGAPAPFVIGWEAADNRPLEDRPKLTIDGSVSELFVLVAQPRDIAVTVEVQASEAAE